MIDLHTHTKYSDGTWTLKELLNNAEKNGVEILSITDHDSIDVYKELEKINSKDYYSGKIIHGAEFNAIFDGIKIELLGYDFDYNKADNFINKIYKEDKIIDLKREYDLFIEACNRNKIQVDKIDYNESMGWPLDVILNSIKKYPNNKNILSDKELNDFDYIFRSSTCNKEFPLYIDFSYQIPDAKLISDKIRESGGKVFLAHLFKYPLVNYKIFLDSLVKENIIDGIEVYYSEFTNEQIEFLEQYCKDNNLFMSAGSDCHGDKKTNRKVGIGYGNMNISKDVILPWINKE